MPEFAGVAANASTPEIKFYDGVVAILREASYNFNPEWHEVMEFMRVGKSEAEAASWYMQEWDVD